MVKDHKILRPPIDDVRQIAGDSSFAPFSEVLLNSPLPLKIPEGSEVEILRRGTLNCKDGDGECHFVFLGTEEAAEVATQEANAAMSKTGN